MKYSELISFKPIESTIQLLETAEKAAAKAERERKKTERRQWGAESDES